MKILSFSLSFLLLAPQIAIAAVINSQPPSDHQRVALQRRQSGSQAALVLLTGQVESKSCEKCPRRKCRKSRYRDQSDCKCKRCGPGMKQNPVDRNSCVPDPIGEGSEKDWVDGRRGQCKPGEILDPAEGGQDDRTTNPKCIPDDKAKCERGDIPASRKKDDSGKAKDKVDCAEEPAKDEKPKCKPDRHIFYTITTAGDVETRCEPTRDFDRKKKKKLDERLEIRKKEYADRNRGNGGDNRDGDQQRQDDERKKQEDEKKSRKSVRMGLCAPLVAAAFDEGLALGGFAPEIFDSPEALSNWPSDLDDVPPGDINQDEYLTAFAETLMAQENNGINGNPWRACKRWVEMDARNLTKRVPPGCKRSLDYEDGDFHQARRVDVDEDGNTKQLNKRFAPLIALFANFAARLTPILARIGAAGSRLANIARQGGPRLAEPGKATAPRQQMLDNLKRVASNKNWRNCLEGKKPLK